MCGQKHSKSLSADESAFAIFSGIGIVFVLISSAIFVYMLTLDSQSANNMVKETEQIQDAYELLGTSSDLEQVLQKATEEVILKDSIRTYDKGAIEITSENQMIGSDGKTIIYDDKYKYDTYKKNLGEEIQNRVFSYYYEGNKTELNNAYSSSIVEYDFSDFLNARSDYSISLEEDNSGGKMLGAKAIFKDGKGIIRSHNTQTSSKLNIKAQADVDINIRPFTMHEKSRDFVTNKLESKDIGWTLWGVQEVIALVEANTKHEVTLATDPQITYTLLHLLVAKKEADEFGSIDYVHIPYEALRPWIGNPEVSPKMKELFSTLKEAEEGGYVDKVKNMERDLNDVKDLHNKYINPASISLWDARTTILNDVKQKDIKTRLESYPPKNKIVNDDLIKDFPSISKPSVVEYIDSTLIWNINTNEMKSLNESIENNRSSQNLKEKIDTLERLQNDLQTDYNGKIQNFSNARINLTDAAGKIDDATSKLLQFQTEVKCQNQFIGYDYFAKEINGKTDNATLNTLIDLSIIELADINEELAYIKDDIDPLENDFKNFTNTPYSSALNSMKNATKLLVEAAEMNETYDNQKLRDEKVDGAINNISVAIKSEKKLISIGDKPFQTLSIKDAIDTQTAALDTQANRIFKPDSKDEVMDTVLKVYLLTKGIKDLQENLNMSSGKENLDQLGESMGFLKSIIAPLMEEMDKFSSIANGLQSADLSIPNKTDQVLSIVPLPPWEIFGDNQKFQPVHQIWWNVGTKKAKIDIPILGKTIESGETIPIPFTSINLNLYTSDIQPSSNVTSGKSIYSHLRLIDFRNAHISEVMEFQISDSPDLNGIYPLPIKYHRYPMYHYMFKAPVITLPIPVIPISFTGTFTQIIPSDTYKPITEDPEDLNYALDVKLEGPYDPETLVLDYSVNSTGEIPKGITIDWNLKDLHDNVLKSDQGHINQSISFCDGNSCITSNLKNYGWDMISISANTSDGVIAYATKVIMKEDFIMAFAADERNILSIEAKDDRVVVTNNKNYDFEAVIKISSDEGCCYIQDENENWGNSVVFDIPKKGKRVFNTKDISQDSVVIETTINIPSQVISALDEVLNGG